MVLRDASGRETSTEIDYFTTAALLREGLYDYSVSVGVPRNDFTRSSFGYSRTFAGTASGRYGFSDRLTLEGHAEASASGFASLGAGMRMPFAGRGVVSLAGALSSSPDGVGSLAFAGLNMQLGTFTIEGEMRRSFAEFPDLAAVTVDRDPDVVPSLGRRVLEFGSLLPPRALERVSVAAPIPFMDLSVSAAYARYVEAGGDRSQVAAVSVSGDLPRDGSFYVRASQELGEKRARSVFAGVSFPIGPGRSAYASAGLDEGSPRFQSYVQQSMEDEPGKLGWRIGHSDHGRSLQSGEFAYGTPVGDLGMGLSRAGDGFNGTLRLNGALAGTADGGIHLSRRINDSFAIVDVGAAGVPVRVNNRHAGITGRGGRVVVPRVASSMRNTIEIDVDRLPLDAVVPRTHATVRPARNNAAVVRLGVETDVATATVVFVDAGGAFLEPGSQGSANGRDFVVGYDGEAYLTHLEARNEVRIDVRGEPCNGSFPLPANEPASRIGPIPCR